MAQRYKAIVNICWNAEYIWKDTQIYSNCNIYWNAEYIWKENKHYVLNMSDDSLW
jgi:hypothetical protein